MDIHASIGKRIKELRLQAGFSQAELADRAATSTEYVSRLERNRSAASVVLLMRLSDALGISLSNLFDFDSEESLDIGKARARRVASILQSADEPVARLLEEFVLKAARQLRGK
jgi:transcriptional regulator with XRE-family HTH domain